MAEEDEKKTVSLPLTPMLIEVPILNKEDLVGLLEAIDEEQAAHLKLRSRARAVMRKAQAALDRWARPDGEAPRSAAKTPLRLVDDPPKKQR